jgi:hypothetical protein
MPLTHSPDINHNIDTTSSHIEKKQDWLGDFNSALDNINSKFALNNLKVELPKTKEQQEKEVLKLVQMRGLKKSFEHNRFTKWVTIKKIKENVFSVISNKTWNINYFVNSDWNIDFWVFNIKERPFIKNWKAFEYAWFVEKKENGIYNMYKIEWNKEVWPIDINSIEYYNAWQDIIFYADIFNKLVSLKHKDPETKKWIYILIDWWSFKFEDLELFLDKWLITQEVFDYWVEEIRKKVVFQCADQRLIKLWIWITESDLKKYLKKWYIDSDLALECYKHLPENMKSKKAK